MSERWAVIVYDARDGRGNQVASRTSEAFRDRKHAEIYRDQTAEFRRGIIERLPTVD